MCGIFSKLSKTNEKIEITKTDLDGMNDTVLKNRGPDMSKYILSHNNLYCFHRLSINDTSSNGMQPMVYKTYTLICNGEIYNYKELIKEYNLFCKSNSDCEVILYLYEKFGMIETVKKLYGVFAFVFSDGNETYLVRDRIGVRPLYMTTTKKHIYVSSVPNALIMVGDDTSDICHKNDTTKNITPVPTGSILWMETGRGDFTEIWRDTINLSITRISDPLEPLRTALIEAVRKRLISDRPIGCMLSGGLDSSLVTSILCRLIGPKNVRTYSVGMENSTDLYYAKKVAETLGTTHTVVNFTEDQAFDVIERVIQALATRDITTIRASIGMFILSEYISKNTTDKVIMSGEGSDELLHGYLYFHKAPSAVESENEGLRLVRNLYIYDVLRCDRCISVHGLEPRVPFLDRNFVDITLSMNATDKWPINGIEKYTLRKAFEGFLPTEILWRKKHAFSDGVGGTEIPFYKILQKYIDPLVKDGEHDNFPSKEAFYYDKIFRKIFGNYDPKIQYWLPQWCGNITEPSATVLNI